MNQIWCDGVRIWCKLCTWETEDSVTGMKGVTLVTSGDGRCVNPLCLCRSL